jgi:hypothetical protein
VTVADLQKCLLSFSQFLTAVKGTQGSITELELVRSKLDVFRDYSLKDFSDFLERAEAYWRSGEIPIQKLKPGQQSARKPKAPKVTFQDSSLQVRQMYNRATDDYLTRETIVATIQNIGGLKLNELKDIASQLDITQKFNKKDEYLKAIEHRILDRKGSAVRVIS